MSHSSLQTAILFVKLHGFHVHEKNVKAWFILRKPVYGLEHAKNYDVKEKMGQPANGMRAEKKIQLAWLSKTTCFYEPNNLRY